MVYTLRFIVHLGESREMQEQGMQEQGRRSRSRGAGGGSAGAGDAGTVVGRSRGSVEGTGAGVDRSRESRVGSRRRVDRSRECRNSGAVAGDSGHIGFLCLLFPFYSVQITSP